MSQSVLGERISVLGSAGYTGETVLTEQSRLLTWGLRHGQTEQLFSSKEGFQKSPLAVALGESKLLPVSFLKDTCSLK